MHCDTSPLLTDLYQLTMLQGYIDHGIMDTAVFEFFVRSLPPERGFLVAAGLETVLDFLETLAFSDEDLAYLSSTGYFTPALMDYLKKFNFTGQVHAVPEGTPVYANEPILRITAPLPEGQLIESRVINILHYQTLIATKAARCRLAGGDRFRLIDFGFRRAHGAEAGLFAARASYLAGFNGTATVIAGERYGIPISGTMAHSFIEAHHDEKEAFLHFAHSNPGNVVLLIDTYDTEKGAIAAVETAVLLQREGITVGGVRLDSGDLIVLSKKVRSILDDAGFPGIAIFVSGNIDEYRIRDFIAADAPIDGIGVGTRLDTSEDVPYLDCAYKLMEYGGEPKLKKSSGKDTYPGAKQVDRLSADGIMTGDIITLADEPCRGTPLIQTFMTDGKRLRQPVPLEDIKSFFLEQMATLPLYLKELDITPPYPVSFSKRLLSLKEELESAL